MKATWRSNLRLQNTERRYAFMRTGRHRALPFLQRAGSFKVEIVSCRVRESARMRAMVQVTEFRILGKPSTHGAVDRVAPNHVPDFAPGDKLRLDTRVIATRNGRSFVQHKWSRSA